MDSSPFAGLPTVVKNLLIINVLTYVVTSMGIGGMSSWDLTHLLGLHFFASPLFEPWQVVTHMFMHAGVGHLFLNMFGLFMLGPPLEYKWGSQRFLTFYMVTGIGAGLLYSGAHWIEYQQLVQESGFEAQLQLQTLLSRPMVGASGAIYGVLLAFGLTYPDVRLILFPFFIPIRAKYFVLILGAMAIYSALERAEGDNVAHLAHLGGMAVGYVMVRLWRARDEQPWQRWN